MRKPRLIAYLAGVSLILTACSGAGGPSPAAQTAAPSAAPPSSSASASTAVSTERPLVTLKFGTSSSISFPDVPTQAALDALREEQNIDVEHVEFESGDQTIRAVVAGQVDVGTVFPSGIMAAAAEGDVKLFFNTKANEWSLACRSDITSPTELTGKKIGRHSPNDLTAALLGNTIQKYDVQPELLTIPGSENRVVALLEGQIDCSPIDIAGLFVLEDERPGGFKPILRYADDLPGLIYTQHVVANTNAIDADKETWELLVLYLMKSFRQASEDADYLAGIADKYLPDEDPELHKKIAQSYVDYKAFTRDGGLTKERMDALMQFYVEAGALNAEDVLPFEEYATTELVDAAIAEIGP
jgi:ABC-type nitrate/sulfonate/bicarbonate transport system substrate-binding protein